MEPHERRVRRLNAQKSGPWSVMYFLRSQQLIWVNVRSASKWGSGGTNRDSPHDEWTSERHDSSTKYWKVIFAHGVHQKGRTYWNHRIMRNAKEKVLHEMETKTERLRKTSSSVRTAENMLPNSMGSCLYDNNTCRRRDKRDHLVLKFVNKVHIQHHQTCIPGFAQNFTGGSCESRCKLPTARRWT